MEVQTASVGSQKVCCWTFCPSFHRGTQCGRVCLPAAGATCGRRCLLSSSPLPPRRDLLFFRNRLPLHVAEFSSYGGDNFDEAVQYLELWIRYSLSCPVAKLSVTSHDKYQRWLLPKGLITSEHLTALQLTRVKTQDDLDFSSCVSLKHLKMTDCGIYCDRIMSPS